MKRAKNLMQSLILTYMLVSVSLPVFGFAQGKFSEALDESTLSIQTNLEKNPSYFNSNPVSRLGGTQEFIYDLVDKFVFPLLIAASVLVVIIGLYEIMFSGKDEIEKGSQYLIYGVLGIIIIQSAKFITSTYIGILNKVVPSDGASTQTFTQSAFEIYNQLVVPFITLFTYVVIAALFVILLVHVMRFITSSEEEVVAKAKTIMISNIVGILVILLAKTIVEAIYGTQEQVLQASTDLGDIGSGILGGADFTIVFTIINYFLGFVGLIILLLIIFQTYQLLVNPTDEELIKKIRTNLLYIIIGLAIIALAYVIVNFFIIQ